CGFSETGATSGNEGAEGSGKPGGGHGTWRRRRLAGSRGRATANRAATAARRTETGSASWCPSPRLHLVRSGRATPVAAVAHGAEGTDARLFALGGLVTVLQDAARGAAGTERRASKPGPRRRGRDLRSRADPRRLRQSPGHHGSAAVGSWLGDDQALRDLQHHGAGEQPT